MNKIRNVQQNQNLVKISRRIQQQLLQMQNLPKGVSKQIIDNQKELQIIVKISLRMITQEVQQLEELQFLIYVQKQKYPYSPPIVCLLTNFSYPRLDDSRNLLDEIIGKDSWWPITMIRQIVQKIPNFAKKLYQTRQNAIKFELVQNQGINKLGNYNFYFNEAMKQQFFQKKAKALIFYRGYYWKNEGYFIGCYKQALIGLGMTNILIFERDSKDIEKVRLTKVIYRESIQKVTRKLIKKQVQVCLILEKANRKIFIKFEQPKIQENVINRIKNLDVLIRCNQLECLLRNIKSGNDKESKQDLKIIYMKEIELLSNFEQEHLQMKFKSQLKEIYIKQDTVNSFYLPN